MICSCGCNEDFEGSSPGQKYKNKKHKDRSYRRRQGATAAKPSAHAERVRIIEKLLEDNGVDIDDIGSVKAVKLNEWDGFMKSVDGQPVVVPLKAASLVLHPSWAEGPKWPVLDRGPAIKLKPRVSKSKLLVGTYKTAQILPDPQIGFRNDLKSGQMQPFHDLDAISVAMQINKDIRPHKSVWLGDYLDLAPISRYLKEEAFVRTMQPAIDYGGQLMAETTENSDETILLEGNHDFRLSEWSLVNANAAFGLTRANKPNEWPVLSVPYLLQLDELNVEYVGGYPAGVHYLNDRLACIHGSVIGNKRQPAAAKVVDDERISVIYGHIHKHETVHKTRGTRYGPRTTVAHSPGCLCRIDGYVPSTHAGFDPRGTVPVRYEDWQHGTTIIHYQEDDGKFKLEPVLITDGWAMYDGKEYLA